MTNPMDRDPDEFLLNVGVWGMGSTDRGEFISQNRLIEQKVSELSGLKCLYAHAYYTEDEFWGIYDRKAYEALREKYNATTLPTIYDKVKTDLSPGGELLGEKKKDLSVGEWVRGVFWGIWPLSGLYGVYRAMVGGEYLLRRGMRDNKGE